MDQQKLRALVFEKTGVKIDIDDPIFALVALNEAVLAEAVERHVELLDDATADLSDQLQALQDSGAACRYNGPAGERPAPALVKPGAAPAQLQEKRLLAIAGGAALLCALLVLTGQALFLRPPPAPPATVIARELTPQQALAIEQGEKLARIVDKLDPKTRSLIQAELKKP